MYGYCCIFKSVLFIHMWLHLVNVVYQNSRKCWGRYLYCLISLFDIFFPVKLYLREYLKRVITRPYDFILDKTSLGECPNADHTFSFCCTTKVRNCILQQRTWLQGQCQVMSRSTRRGLFNRNMDALKRSEIGPAPPLILEDIKSGVLVD